MFPFLESAGGNCQDAVILVEELALTVKLVGAFEGAAIGIVKRFVRLVVWTDFALKSKNERAQSTREAKQINTAHYSYCFYMYDFDCQ